VGLLKDISKFLFLHSKVLDFRRLGVFFSSEFTKKGCREKTVFMPKGCRN